MTFGKLMPAAIAILAMSADASVMAQDTHGHDSSAQSPEAAAPAACPMGRPGMGPQAMHGTGGGAMQQGIGDRQQVHQAMQQMRTEMQQMRSEMMALRQVMQRRRGNPD